MSKHPISNFDTEEDVLTSQLKSFDNDEDSASSSTNDNNCTQYSTVHYNDEGECIGGVLRSE